MNGPRLFHAFTSLGSELWSKRLAWCRIEGARQDHPGQFILQNLKTHVISSLFFSCNLINEVVKRCRQTVKYSGDPNTGIVRYSDHGDLSDCQMVRCSDHHLNNEQKLSAIQTTIWIPDYLPGSCPLLWSPLFKWFRYSNVRYSDPHCKFIPNVKF